MRLYDRQAWRKGRAKHLRDNPLCVSCKQIGKIAVAQVVDHIKPHKGNEELFFNEGNWQSLCKPCHDAKTATQDGGYGNRKLSAGEVKPRQGCTVDGLPLDRAHHWHKG